jgi:hypothetical protein
MHGRALLLLAILSAPLCSGCKNKPVHIIKPPTEQLWDLPPSSKQFDEPPTYPEDKPLQAPPKKDGSNPMQGQNRPGGGGGGQGSMNNQMGPGTGGAGSGRGY